MAANWICKLQSRRAPAGPVFSAARLHHGRGTWVVGGKEEQSRLPVVMAGWG